MQLKEPALAVAALTLVATSTNAPPRHRDHRPLKIVIETVDHQRYRTAGDWQLKPDGLHIFVSRMRDQRYEFLAACTRRSKLTCANRPASRRSP